MVPFFLSFFSANVTPTRQPARRLYSRYAAERDAALVHKAKMTGSARGSPLAPYPSHLIPSAQPLKSMQSRHSACAIACLTWPYACNIHAPRCSRPRRRPRRGDAHVMPGHATGDSAAQAAPWPSLRWARRSSPARRTEPEEVSFFIIILQNNEIDLPPPRYAGVPMTAV